MKLTYCLITQTVFSNFVSWRDLKVPNVKSLERYQYRMPSFCCFYRGVTKLIIVTNTHEYSRTVPKSRLLRQRNRYQNAIKVVCRLPDGFGTRFYLKRRGMVLSKRTSKTSIYWYWWTQLHLLFVFKKRSWLLDNNIFCTSCHI